MMSKVMKIRLIFTHILSTILILQSYCSAGELINGKVVKVVDGDSIVVRTKTSFMEIRLYGIDAPEYGQPFSNAAKQFVKNLTERKQVQLKPLYKDSYSRTVAIVQVGNNLLNEELVREGYAWVYPRYCRKKICEKWAKYETIAQDNRKGLWAAPRPVAPWIYKRHKKK